MHTRDFRTPGGIQAGYSTHSLWAGGAAPPPPCCSSPRRGPRSRRGPRLIAGPAAHLFLRYLGVLCAQGAEEGLLVQVLHLRGGDVRVQHQV